MTEPPDTQSRFSELGLSAPLLRTLDALGYEEPTPIQELAIPPLLAGRDLLGRAATGTGKTAAFALPLLERIATRIGRADQRPEVRALVLVPTRELAIQVAEAIHRYGRELGVHVLPVYGGQAMQQQLRALSRGVEVVVATPGRALDHIRRGTLDLRGVTSVVLDEADEMLDMGFADDLEAILAAVPASRQTALFSATIPPRIARLAESHMRDPARITIESEPLEEGDVPRLRQLVYMVHRRDKIAALGRVLDMESPTSAIVFCRTRTEVDELTEKLESQGYRAESLHGGISQEQRSRVMRRFRDGAFELLIATDVAARGLDISHVSHVVNFDVPSAPDAYVHRVGRTGRAGREGTAVTFAEPRERRLLRNIEQLTGQKMQPAVVPTSTDLHARRMELTGAAVRKALLAGDIERYAVVVESLADEFDVMDIAAAAVKVAHEATRTEVASAGEIPTVREEPVRRERRARPTVQPRERPAVRERRERDAGDAHEIPQRRPRGKPKPKEKPRWDRKRKEQRKAEAQSADRREFRKRDGGRAGAFEGRGRPKRRSGGGKTHRKGPRRG